MTDLRDCSRPFRQGYGARTNGHKAHENPYHGSFDLAGLYAARQWAEGWAEADGDKRVRSKIREMSREIAEKMKQAST
jgi:hypothetical protein